QTSGVWTDTGPGRPHNTASDTVPPVRALTYRRLRNPATWATSRSRGLTGRSRPDHSPAANGTRSRRPAASSSDGPGTHRPAHRPGTSPATRTAANTVTIGSVRDTRYL